MTNAKPQSTSASVDVGIWMVVFGELCLFTLFFATFLYYQSLTPLIFRDGRLALDSDLGLLNTLLLLTSSWCVANAMHVLRRSGNATVSCQWLAGGITCGILFVSVKVLEYGAAFREGVNVTTNDFFMFYFMLTAIHLFHLLIGIALLSVLTVQIRRYWDRGSVSESLKSFSTNFWHMLDLVWIILFPLLYLLG